MVRYTVTLISILGLCLAACGGKKGETSAAKGPSERVVGSWTLDADEMLKSVPEEQRKLAAPMMKAMQMDITFTKDTVSVTGSMMGKKIQESSTYKVVKTDGDTLTIEITDKGKTKPGTIIVKDGKLQLKKGENARSKTLHLKRK